MTALRPWEASITGDGEPERLGGAYVSANFFSFLGVPLERGRTFVSDEEQPGKDKVVVISDALWRRRYGSDPAVIGRTIVINGTNHLIIGVAPPSLVVPTETELHVLLPFAPRIDIWKPIAPTPASLNQESWDHGVLVRLPDGGSLEQGRQQLAAILTEMARAQMPHVKTEIAIDLVPIREVYAGRARLRLLLILAASALLLLTACVSIANVFLARVASRGNEFATRIALGAGRGRILSQLLTETVLLAIFGGAIGAFLATWGATAIAFYGPRELRLLADTAVNLPFLVFAIAVSVTTGILCGIVPAWQAYRKEPGTELKEAGRTMAGGQAGTTRSILVGVEIALATILLASAGLLLHSFVRVMNTDRGYDVERVLTADLSLFGNRYEPGEARAAFYATLLENVRALPGVLAAGAISNLPALSSSDGASRAIFYRTDTDFQSLVLARPVAMIRGVTEGYFAASGNVLRAGRLLTPDEPVPTALISESLANRLWPDKPLTAVAGQQFRQGDIRGPLITVAGVVADAHPGGLDREPPPTIYRPYKQWASGPMTIVVRTAQEPAALAGALRAEVWKLDPNLPIAAVRTMREIVSSTVAERRFQMTLTMLFAAVALLLGALGVYGVVSYSVACRTRDIGLRMALGALRSDVMRWVFAGGMRPVLIGLAAGLVSAIAIARTLRSVLFQVGPADSLSLGLVVFVLLLTSALACYLPARRAAGMDPVIALRHE
jgi:putative ABC transport system permease protein